MNARASCVPGNDRDNTPAECPETPAPGLRLVPHSSSVAAFRERRRIDGLGTAAVEISPSWDATDCPDGRGAARKPQARTDHLSHVPHIAGSSVGPARRSVAELAAIADLIDGGAFHGVGPFGAVELPTLDLVETPGTIIARLDPQHCRREAQSRESACGMSDQLTSEPTTPVFGVHVDHVKLTACGIVTLALAP